jgi:hypothetical protein
MTLDPNTNPTGDLRKVASKLDALDTRLSSAIKGARARNFIALVLATASAIMIGGWLYYAHVRFSSEVNPDLVASVMQQYIDENLPAASAQLESSLKSNAPSVVSEGEKQLRALPGRLQDQFHQSASKALDAEMPDFQTRLTATLEDGLASARAEASQVPGKDDEARFREMVRSMASTYGTETTRLVDDVNGQYTKASGDIVAGLTLLAEGKNLTPQQKTQRNLVRDFLIMAREASAANAK